MDHKTSRWDLMLLSAVLVLTFAREAYGYIDPGTGSLILQVIIGSLLGAAFAIKIFWRHIMYFAGRLFGRKKRDDTGED